MFGSLPKRLNVVKVRRVRVASVPLRRTKVTKIDRQGDRELERGASSRSYFASPSCFMKSWLSQNSHSWSIVPPFQWPIVAMPRRKDLPVGGMDLPSPIGIG